MVWLISPFVDGELVLFRHFWMHFTPHIKVVRLRFTKAEYEVGMLW